MEEERKQRHRRAVRKWSAAHPEKKREHNKKYRERHKEKLKAYWREYHQTNKEKRLQAQKEYYQTHRENYRGYGRTRDRRLRERVFQLLGGARCSWEGCGIEDTRCLQIDHVNGGGNRERKALGTSGVLRRALQSPDDYSILCANHNQIKRFEQEKTRASTGA